MRKRLFHTKRGGGGIGVFVFVALLCGAVAAIGAGVVMHRGPDTAFVIATTQDCRRAFDEAKCQAIAASALAVHANSAPRYAQERVCELNFGLGACTSVSVLNMTFFAPEVAVVVMARDAADDAKALVPLYFEPDGKGESVDEARRVYYRGAAVGVLHRKRFAGAGISMLTDLSGKPLSSSAVRRLRNG